MRNYKHLSVVWGGLLAVLSATAHPAYTQTLVQEPVSLNTVPRGATAANPYWQHLVIDLVRNPSAGNVIVIPLPAGVTVADTDGDGSLTDEISLDGETGRDTGYQATTGSTADSIRIVFPIIVVLARSTIVVIRSDSVMSVPFGIKTLCDPSTTDFSPSMISSSDTAYTQHG